MPDQHLTNEELALHFLQIMSAYSGSLVYRSAYLAIKESPIDLSSFYQEHKSLRDLPMKHFSENTKNALELILEQGVEEATRIINEQKIADIRDSVRHRIRGVKGRVSGGRLYRHDEGKFKP